MKDQLCLASWNVGGITSPQKRKKILAQLKKCTPDIVFLQETHLKEVELVKLTTGWVGEVIGTPCLNRKKGVAFLFNKKLHYKIIETELDLNERFIILQLEVEGMALTLCNIYGPNKPDNAFWDRLQVKLLPYYAKNLIIAGDFNRTLYPALDRLKHTSIRNNKTETKRFKMFNKTLGLKDIWRIQNPDLKKYTCESQAHQTMSRLDYFLIVDKLLGFEIFADIKEIIISDHAIITLNIKIRNNQATGNRFFFPKHLASNVQFIAWIKLKWKEFYQYNYNPEIKTEILWETFKAVIRGEIKAYLVIQKRKMTARDTQLANQLRNAYNAYISDPRKKMWDMYQRKKREREVFITQKMAREEIRTRFFFYRYGGKSGQFLANIVKIKQKKPPIESLKTLQGRIVNIKEIEKYIFQYFQNLYSENKINPQIKDNFWKNIQIPKIEKSKLEELNKPISQQEVMLAIKKAAANKAAGPDQIPSELYKCLIEEISPTLVRLFNNYYTEGRSCSNYFTASLVALILKKGKDKEEIGSYRPISLLNSDYKILTSIIAARLKLVLGPLIHKDQVGFMPGRNSSRNLRKIQLILNYFYNIEQKGNQSKMVDAAIVAIDAEKAFDSITWDHLFSVLARFGVEGPFSNFIHLIYNQPTAAIIINDRPSPSFQLKRGSRQGCPLSPYLFNMALEPLAICLRKEIEGIKIGTRQVTTLLYADDLLVLMSNTKENIPRLTQILQDFSAFSGYKVNVTKTEIFWLRKQKNSFIDSQFKEAKEAFIYLGIKLSRDSNDWYRNNYPPIIAKIINDFKNWAKFKLTLTGKINLIKMIIFPKLLYLMQNIPIMIKHQDLIAFKQGCLQFLWGDKRRAISFKTLSLYRTEGGLALPNLEIYNLVAISKIAIDWITGADYYSTQVFEENLAQPYSLIALLHCEAGKCPAKIRQMPAIYNVIRAWQKILKMLNVNFSVSKYLTIMGNPKFTPAISSKLFRGWADKGLRYIGQLRESNTGRTKLFSDLKQEFALKNTEFYAFLQVRHYIQTLVFDGPDEDTWDILKPILNSFRIGKYSISLLYKTIVRFFGQQKVQKIAEDWQVSPEIVQKSFKLVDSATLSSSWRESHTKMINRIYITPQIKARWSDEGSYCHKCKLRKADLHHCFWSCVKIKKFWFKINYWISKVNRNQFKIIEKHVFFLIDGQKEPYCRVVRQYNAIIMVGRLLILKYWKSNKAPNLIEFLQKLKNQIIMEQMDTSINSETQIKRFFNKWKSIILSYPLEIQKQLITPFRGTIYLELAIAEKEFPNLWTG